VKHGRGDRGDIEGIPLSVFELKNVRSLSLGAWVDECERERVNDGAEFGLTIVKRKQKGDPGDAFVVIPLRRFVPILVELLVARGKLRKAS
jgi:hypothetical protein